MNKNVKAEAVFLVIVVISTAMLSIPLTISVTLFTALLISTLFQFSRKLKSVSLITATVLLAAGCQNTGTKTEDKIAVSEENIQAIDSAKIAVKTSSPVKDTVKIDTLQAVVKKDTLAKVYPIDTLPAR
jgi:hypothetical protein